MRNGHFLVTEINGDWVDEITLAGTCPGSWHPPGFTYPSDTNEVYARPLPQRRLHQPGPVETFDRDGRLVWRYGPPRRPPLNHPSLAEPLPNGDILLNDDDNNRVIVIDPHTNRIVWQYGHTGTARQRARLPQRPRRHRPRSHPTHSSSGSERRSAARSDRPQHASGGSSATAGC